MKPGKSTAVAFASLPELLLSSSRRVCYIMDNEL